MDQVPGKSTQYGVLNLQELANLCHWPDVPTQAYIFICTPRSFLQDAPVKTNKLVLALAPRGSPHGGESLPGTGRSTGLDC